jgi:hypothetical protein
MNKIITVTAKKNEIAYLEIEIDGKPLGRHFPLGDKVRIHRRYLH